MLVSCHQNAGEHCDLKIEDRLFANVSQYKTAANQNFIQEKIKSLNSVNACYRSIQDHLSFCLLFKN
jgi:hypothetical protein